MLDRQGTSTKGSYFTTILKGITSGLKEGFPGYSKKRFPSTLEQKH